MMLGARTDGVITTPPGAWEAFAKAGILPDLSDVHFIARAITPPKRPLRFDSRFFAADVSAIAHRVDGMVGPDAELVELVWLPITQARTPRHAGHHRGRARRTARPHRRRHEPRFSGAAYRMLHKRFVREIL